MKGWVAVVVTGDRILRVSVPSADRPTIQEVVEHMLLRGTRQVVSLSTKELVDLEPQHVYIPEVNLIARLV